MPLKAGLYIDAHNLYRKDGPSLNYRAIKDFVSDRYELLRCNVYVTVDPENPKPVRGFMAALWEIGFKVIEDERVTCPSAAKGARRGVDGHSPVFSEINSLLRSAESGASIEYYEVVLGLLIKHSQFLI